MDAMVFDVDVDDRLFKIAWLVSKGWVLCGGVWRKEGAKRIAYPHYYLFSEVVTNDFSLEEALAVEPIPYIDPFREPTIESVPSLISNQRFKARKRVRSSGLSHLGQTAAVAQW